LWAVPNGVSLVAGFFTDWTHVDEENLKGVIKVELNDILYRNKAHNILSMQNLFKVQKAKKL